MFALSSRGFAGSVFPNTGALFGIAGVTIESTTHGATTAGSCIAVVITVVIGIAAIAAEFIAVPALGSPGCGPRGAELGDGDAVEREVGAPEKSSGRVDADVGTARDTRSFDGTLVPPSI